MLVAESIDFSLKLVGLLFFDHFHVPLRYFLDLGKAAVGETISEQTNVDQSSIFVELLEHEGFDWLTEEIVSKFDLTDEFVVLESIDQEEKSRVVQFAWREVKTLQLGGTSADFPWYDHSKNLENFIAKEVFIANECLNVGSW